MLCHHILVNQLTTSRSLLYRHTCNYSDFEDHHNEFDDSVYYVDCNNHELLANAISKIRLNKNIRDNLIQNGFKKLEQLKQNNVSNTIPIIFKKYFNIQQTWK